MEKNLFIELLDIAKREGAQDQHFRYEGKMRDRVMVSNPGF